MSSSLKLLTTKPDAAASYARWDAWWDCQIRDRTPVTIGVTSTATPEPARPKTYSSHRDQWMDLDTLLARHAAWVSRQEWLADSFPTFMPNLGPEVMATLYGCSLEFGPSTVWSTPVCHSCREVLERQPDFTTPYWQWLHQATLRSLELGAGKWITAITDLHSNGDLLAALRDPQDLLLEMLEDPDAVEAAMRHITPVFDQCFADLADPIAAAGQPIMSWVHAPVLGRGLVLQVDLICMIGSDLFRRLILPAIRHETEILDRSIFHLDGPNALHHLDDLLALPRLNAVQWVSGAGNGPADRWLEVYRRIQAAGKANQVFCGSIDEAEAIMRGMRPEGLWLCVCNRYPRPTVESFLERVTRWSQGQPW